MASNENTGITESTSAPIENQETPNQGQSQIPEKFLGKSQEDIIKSYQELESELGRLRNEYGMAKKERDEAISRLMSTYQSQQVNTQQSPDPFEVFEKHFDNDPKTAIAEAMKLQEKKLLTHQQEQLRALRQAAAVKYYEEQRANPDFVRREPLMQQLALRFSSLLNRDALDSPEAIQLLDYLSRGADISYYEKEAVERARKSGFSTRDEKLNAQTESPTSGKGGDVDFASLSLAEMEKRLGRSE